MEVMKVQTPTHFTVVKEWTRVASRDDWASEQIMR